MHGEDVGLGVFGKHHGVALEDAAQRGDVVAVAGGLLVLEPRDGVGHLALELLDEARALPAHELAELGGELLVVLGADPAHAGGRALVDVAEQAGPAGGFGALEHAHGAAAHREDAQQGVEGLADRLGRVERAEVLGVLALVPAHDLRARVGLPHGDREVRVGLVVAEDDVEARVVLLDPGVLQLQRLQLGAHHGPLDRAGGVHHRVGLGRQPRGVGEVGVQPGAQHLGLADVDDPPDLVAEAVDAGIQRDVPGLGSVALRVCHVYAFGVYSAVFTRRWVSGCRRRPVPGPSAPRWRRRSRRWPCGAAAAGACGPGARTAAACRTRG